MPDTTNIAPVKERLASVLGGSQADWGAVVGRHFGRRSRLVHGSEERVVSKEHVEQLRMIVETLLAAELGVASPPHEDSLRAAADI